MSNLALNSILFAGTTPTPVRESLGCKHWQSLSLPRWWKSSMCCALPLFHIRICNSMDCSLPGSSVQGDSPGKNTKVGCHALLQGIFSTQGSNPSLLRCRGILHCLSHQAQHLKRRKLVTLDLIHKSNRIWLDTMIPLGFVIFRLKFVRGLVPGF